MLRMWLTAARQLLQEYGSAPVSKDLTTGEWTVEDYSYAIAYENDLIYAREAWAYGRWRCVSVAIDWEDPHNPMQERSWGLSLIHI